MNEDKKEWHDSGKSAPGKIALVLMALFLLGSCVKPNTDHEEHLCKICGRPYDFNWSDVCNGCQGLMKDGWFDID